MGGHWSSLAGGPSQKDTRREDHVTPGAEAGAVPPQAKGWQVCGNGREREGAGKILLQSRQRARGPANNLILDF